KVLISLGINKVFSEIANSEFRLRLKGRLGEAGIQMVNLIHPNTYIAPSVKLGQGNFIKVGAIIDSNTCIGNCCIIDNNVIIAHDNIVEDSCHLAPGVTLGSGITIGKKTIIGIGASISTKVRIGKDVIVGVGSSVVQDVPDNSIVEGVPGKIIGKRK
ncbi:transferase, partial [Candidatus Omnitrophota bacterium]